MLIYPAALSRMLLPDRSHSPRRGPDSVDAEIVELKSNSLTKGSCRAVIPGTLPGHSPNLPESTRWEATFPKWVSPTGERDASSRRVLPTDASGSSAEADRYPDMD